MANLDQICDYLADKNAEPVLIEYLTAFYFYKQGDQVIVESYGGKLNPQTQLLSVGTLTNTSLFPDHEITSPMLWGNMAQYGGLIRITTTGNVQIYSQQNLNAAEAWCSFSYFV